MWVVIFACILEMTNGDTHLEESILNPPPHTQMEVLFYKLQLGSLVLNSLALENRLTRDIQPVSFGCTDWMLENGISLWRPTTPSCWSPEQERGSHSMTALDWRLGQLQYPGFLTNLLCWLQSIIEKEHFHILGQLQPKPQSNVLSNPSTNPRCVLLLCTSQAIFVRYSYLEPCSICSKKIKALIVIDTEYSNMSLPFSVSCDDFY